MQDFRRLAVWQKSHRLTLDIYHATKDFPPDERFALTQDLRSAARSIPTNIAEGCGRTRPSMRHFLQIALGSASEVEYHLFLARELGVAEPGVCDRLSGQTAEIKRMLAGLIARLRAADRPPRPPVAEKLLLRTDD